jgi:Flp pilus assembly protein TadG
MFALLSVLGLVVDTGAGWMARHQAQVAADSAALGAAQDLTGAATDTSTTQDAEASTDGTSVADANDSGANVQVTAPYDGDATTAQVVVTKSVPLPFGFTAHVSATAIAKNNVVQNGSFNGTVTNSFIEYCAANGVTTQGSQDFSCPTANPTMNSWTVYSGGVDLNDSSYIAAPASDPTAQSLDLVGSCSYNPNADPITCTNQTNGTIYEALSTIPGDTYTLSFDMSANPYGGPAYKPFSVWVSSNIVAPYGFTDGTEVGSTFYATPDGSNWTPEGTSASPLTFVAPAATTYLWFFSQVNCAASNQSGGPTTAVAPNCRYGAAITDISVAGPSSDNLTQ